MEITEAEMQKLSTVFHDRYTVGDIDSCWEYQGGVSSTGYGVVRSTVPLGSNKYKQLYMYAHRLSYLLHYGDLPPSLHCCHKCDNPICVNPNHLFLGDAQANQTDKVLKNRQLKGIDHSGVKYTEDQIREWKFGTESARSIAERMAIDPSYIYGIRGGKYWKHIERL